MEGIRKSKCDGVSKSNNRKVEIRKEDKRQHPARITQKSSLEKHHLRYLLVFFCVEIPGASTLIGLMLWVAQVWHGWVFPLQQFISPENHFISSKVLLGVSSGAAPRKHITRLVWLVLEASSSPRKYWWSFSSASYKRV